MGRQQHLTMELVASVMVLQTEIAAFFISSIGRDFKAESDFVPAQRTAYVISSIPHPKRYPVQWNPTQTKK